MHDRAKHIHSLIVVANDGLAREELLRWQRKGVGRVDLVTFAQLSWRVAMPELGIRALQKLVRPTARKPIEATSEEIAEYGHCLIKHGAVVEGEKILHSIDDKKVPRALFYSCSARFTRWDYAGSIEPLKNYIALTSDRYQKLVGQLNLASAYVYEDRNEEAEKLLVDLETICRREQFILLYGRVMELRAHVAVAYKKWEKAREHIQSAQLRVDGSLTLDALFIRKFSAVIDFLRKPSAVTRGKLEDIRSEALQRQHWESVRDCDRKIAVATKDEGLTEKVFHGTPYPHYRARFAEELGRPIDSFAKEYEWRHEGAEPRRLDFSSETFLEPGTLPHRLLGVLAADRYRPPRLAAVFATLYPDRHYNLESSPALVYDALIRLREAFKVSRIPLVVDERQGFYHLSPTAALCLRLPSNPIVGDRRELTLERLRAQLAATKFSLSDAVRALSLPKRSVQRFLQTAFESQALKKVGSGNQTRYHFT